MGVNNGLMTTFILWSGDTSHHIAIISLSIEYRKLVHSFKKLCSSLAGYLECE